MTTADQWLETAPTHWSRGRLKNLILTATNGTWGSDPVEDEADVHCVRAADFDRVSQRVTLTNAPLRHVEPSSLRQHLLEAGDLVLEKSGGGDKQPVGMAVLFTGSGKAVCSNFCARIKPSTQVDHRFLTYVFAAAYGQGLTQAAIKQTTGIQNLDTGAFFASRWAYPALEEQRRIADFLDSETRHVDAVARTREAQLRCLQQLWRSRLATTAHELIEAHGLVPLRRVVSSVEQGWSPQCEDVEAVPHEWSVLKTSAVSSGIFLPLEHKRLPSDLAPDLRYKIADGDILMTRGSGSPAHVGVAALAETQDRNLLLSDLLYRVKVGYGWSPRFVTLMLSSQPIRGYMSLLFRGQSGQTIKLRAEDIKSITVPAAPIHTQDAIAEELEAERHKIDASCTALNRSQLLLTERRQALITAAVTGQFDVSTASGRNVTEGVTV
ncbi:restriction endonuclease subunit S [Streptomyces sp. RB13]|uniref:restriction endonuclease subunit S n=1 Tax=Streptomyces sp. RB13 TaxID=2950978 RepID=UPI002FCA6DA6